MWRKLLITTTTILAGCAVGSSVVSSWYVFRSGLSVGLVEGALRVQYFHAMSSDDKARCAGWQVRADFDLVVVPTFRDSPQVLTVIVPGWPVLITLAVLFVRSRRQSAHRCAQCGYDRRGLAADAKCPECGTVPKVE